MVKLAHIKIVKLRNKCALVWEESGCPRNGTPMGMSLLALAHLVMKHTIQVKARQNIVLLMSYDTMPPYGGCGG